MGALTAQKVRTKNEAQLCTETQSKRSNLTQWWPVLPIADQEASKNIPKMRLVAYRKRNAFAS